MRPSKRFLSEKSILFFISLFNSRFNVRSVYFHLFFVLFNFSFFFGKIAAFVSAFFLGPRVALPSPSLLCRARGWPFFSVIARPRPQEGVKRRRGTAARPKKKERKKAAPTQRGTAP